MWYGSACRVSCRALCRALVLPASCHGPSTTLFRPPIVKASSFPVMVRALCHSLLSSHLYLRRDVKRTDTMFVDNSATVEGRWCTRSKAATAGSKLASCSTSVWSPKHTQRPSPGSGRSRPPLWYGMWYMVQFRMCFRIWYIIWHMVWCMIYAMIYNMICDMCIWYEEYYDIWWDVSCVIFYDMWCDVRYDRWRLTYYIVLYYEMLYDML